MLHDTAWVPRDGFRTGTGRGAQRPSPGREYGHPDHEAEQLGQDPGGRPPDGLAGRGEEPHRELPAEPRRRSPAGRGPPTTPRRTPRRRAGRRARRRRCGRPPRELRGWSAGTAGSPPPASCSVAEETVGIGVRCPTTVTSAGSSPTSSQASRRAPCVGRLPGVEAPAGEGHLPAVGAQLARAHGEQHPRLTRLLEQGHQHGGRVGVRVGVERADELDNSLAVIAASASRRGRSPRRPPRRRRTGRRRAGSSRPRARDGRGGGGEDAGWPGVLHGSGGGSGHGPRH